MSEKFGVMIACYAGDMHYAKASYMSVRHFLGDDMPICFIVDGDPKMLDKMHDDPKVSYITRENVTDSRLQETGFGWGFTKMVGIWHTPFEEYLYMDADALVWGDVVSAYFENGHDFIVDQQYSYTDEQISFWFFSTKTINRHYPDFDHAAFRERYACGGTFFAKRDALDLADWYEAAMIQKNTDDVFLFGGDMGPLNFLWAYGTQKGTVDIKSLTYQVIPVDHEDSELQAHYSPQALHTKQVKPAILHYCGRKATIFWNSPKTASMNYFRRRYLVEVDGLADMQATLRMAVEDFRFVFIPWLKRGVRKAKRIMKSFFAKK